MSIKKFVKFLIRNNIEFTMGWSPDGQTYGISVILGNCKYCSSINDKQKLLEIKNTIQTYWTWSLWSEELEDPSVRKPGPKNERTH